MTEFPLNKSANTRLRGSGRITVNPTVSVAVTVLVMLLLTLSLAAGVSAQTKVIVGPDDDGPKIDAPTRNEVIDSVCYSLLEFYCIPDTAQAMVAYLRQQQKDGAYDDITHLRPLTQKLTEDVRSVFNDRHLGIHVPPPDQLNSVIDTAAQRRMQEEFRENARRANYGFKELKILDGNVGYLDLRGFSSLKEARATGVGAMNFLNNTDAIIIDLRQNGGGSPDMINLITSYFFEDPVHLNSFYVRDTDSIKQFWTTAHVDGEKVPETPLYILTSNYTFSAAEEFTYNLSNLERATVVGETTGGGAHPVDGHVFPSLGFGMRIPFGRAINPITGTNWEGVGVKPHIECNADQAMDVAYLTALKEIRKNTEDERRMFTIDWAITGLEAKQNPVALEASQLEKYAGQYGPRKIWLEDGSLHYQRDDGPTYTLIPMGDDLFALDGLEWFRIQFVVEAGGPASELIGLYMQGNSDRHKRIS